MYMNLKLLKIDKDLLIIVAGRLIQIVIALATIRLLTDFLSPEELGNYYVILAFMSFFNLVFLNPPSMYFVRQLLEWQRSKNLLNALCIFIFWIAIIAFLAVPISIVAYKIGGYDAKFELSEFIIFVLAGLVFSTIHRNVLYGTNTLGYRKKFVIFLIFTLVIGLILSTLIVYFYNRSALSWLMGQVLSEILMLYFIFSFFIEKNKLDLEKIRKALTKEKLKKIMVFSLPIAVTTFCMWGQNSGYRLIIDYKYSAEVLGFMGVGLTISASIFASIEAIAMQYLNPIFLKNILDSSRQERTSAWNNMASILVPIYILATVFTICLSEALIGVLANQKFQNAYLYISLGVGIEFFRVMTNLLAKVAHSEYQTILTIKPYLLGFFISIGLLGIIDIGTYHFILILILIFAYFCVFIYMYIAMKRLLDIKLKINKLRTILLCSPFFIIYLLNLDYNSKVQNVLITFLFGSYFLVASWLVQAERLKVAKT